MAGKNTHIVGNLQMAYEPLFMPFKDKPSTNPRYEALYNILGRVNDKLQTNDDCDSGKRGLERAESSDSSRKCMRSWSKCLLSILCAQTRLVRRSKKLVGKGGICSCYVRMSLHVGGLGNGMRFVN